MIVRKATQAVRATRKATPADFTFNVQDLIYCCGIAEVGSFALKGTENKYLSSSIIIDWGGVIDKNFFNSVKAIFDNLISEEEVYDDEGEHISGTYGALIATTTWQQSDVNAILTNTGWEKISTNTNPNSGNTLYTWMYNRHKE